MYYDVTKSFKTLCSYFMNTMYTAYYCLHAQYDRNVIVRFFLEHKACKTWV